MHQWRNPRHRYRDYAKGLIVGLSDWRGAAAMPPLFLRAAEAREVGAGGLNWYKAPK